MSGLGAWFFGWYRYGMAVPNDRVGAGIVAFKRELEFNGFGKGIVVDLEKFGSAAQARTREFQKAESIAADGVIGPTTAKHLFRKRGRELQALNGCPNDYLLRIARLESQDDPVAEGYSDPDDEGLVQINLRYHGSISQAEAWNPEQALAWAEAHLTTSEQSIGSWKGAVAAWNVGDFYAKLWTQQGYPSSGGPLIGGVDSFARAARYLDLIDQQNV